VQVAYPPDPVHSGEIANLLLVFATVVEDRQATYVSSPFTTGPLASAWAARNGFEHVEAALASSEFAAEVLTANRARAATVVRGLRQQESTAAEPVISPTALPDVPGWTQDDYRFFWGRVIEEYAARVVFLDGWHESSGCAYEYAVAARCGLPTLDERLCGLEVADALPLLERAAGRATSKANAAFLRAVASDVRGMVTNQPGQRS